MQHAHSHPVRGSGRDRRLECRYGTDVPCSVVILAGEKRIEQPAHLVDISQHGAALQCSSRIPLHVAVKVRLGDLELPAQVCRVQKLKTGFFRWCYLIGLRLKRPWPNEVFQQVAFPDAYLGVGTGIGEDDEVFSRLVRNEE